MNVFHYWFKRTFGTKKIAPDRPRSTKLQLEVLEDRLAPAVSPTVAITSPASGSFTNSAEPTLTATASDVGGPGLATVQFQFSFNGGAWTNAGTAETTAPFAYTFSTPLPDGDYAVRAIATDKNGVQATSPLVPVANSLKTLSTFDGNTAASSENLIMDGSGDLFGTLTTGGNYAQGAVFEVAAGSSAVTTLASFNGADGANPVGSLVEDSAGDLFGTTEIGGADNDGTVFEVAAGSNAITTLASFTGADGEYPLGGLVLDNAGDVFGTTSQGDANVYGGTLFEVVKGSGAITTLAAFNGADGSTPEAGLIEDSAGNFFGTASQGGANGDGTVFEFVKGSSAITTLASFNGAFAANPDSSLFEDSAGDLFGTTSSGANGDSIGAVYELAAESSSITVLAYLDTVVNNTYDSGDGSGVIENNNGQLIGDTSGGGANYYGAIFQVPAASPQILSASASGGTVTITTSAPNSFATGDSVLIQGVDGTGNAASGFDGDWVVSGASGNSFTYDDPGASGSSTGAGTARSDTAATVFSFSTNQFDPASPGGVIENSIGDLFGVAGDGGSDGMGAVFEYAPGSALIDSANASSGVVTITTGAPNGFFLGESVNIAGVDGTGTAAGFNGEWVITGISGNTFTYADAGATGGSTGAGSAFSSISTVASFNDTITAFGETNGIMPQGSLVVDSNGNLFGTTSGGGYSGGQAGIDGYPAVPGGGLGTVYEVATGTGAITTLASFGDLGEDVPLGGVIEDSAGDLFGTTSQSGVSDPGSVFEIAAGGNTLTTLATFPDNSNNPSGIAASPTSGLVEDSAGDLFGTTEDGGAYGDGTVYELAAAGTTITTLASFDGADGAFPVAGLVLDSAGDLFGTTSEGGDANGDGTVFEIAANSNSITTLAEFNGADGSQPDSALVADGAGNLIGTAEYGGTDGDGAVFKVAAGSHALTVLASFTGQNGANPNGPLIEDSGGDLFGTTTGAEVAGSDTVFEIPAGSSTITTLVSFPTYPAGSNNDISNPDGAIPNALVQDSNGNLFGTTISGGPNNDAGTVFEIPAAPISFVVDTVPPTVVMTSPANNSSSGNPEPTLTATASDTGGSGLASVQFQYRYDAGGSWTDVGPALTSAPFSCTFTQPLAPDTYEARAVATDNLGGSTTSAPVVFTVTVPSTPVVTVSTANLLASGTTLIIHGSDFSSTAADDAVTFNGEATGTVAGATATALTVTGLSGLIAGSLTAIATSDFVSSGAPVPVATVLPVATGSTASLGANADSLTIDGFGFDPTATNDTVTFGNAVTGTLSSATNTQLIVTNLTGLTPGALKASVKVDGENSGTAVQVATVKPVVSISTAGLTANATTLIIQGFGFSSTAADDTVALSDGATGKVTKAGSTTLTVTSLAGLVAGNLTATVAVGGESSGSVQVATVTPVVTAGTAILLANAASLVIHGFGFSSTAANDTVTFSNGATGKVTKATATALTVTDLSGLSAGSLSATVTDNSVSTTSPVQVATVTPVVTAGTASLGANATSLTIDGFGFDPTPANDTVTFSNGVTGTFSSATNTQLIVINLTGLTPGALKASVKVDGESSGTAVQVATVKPVVSVSTADLAANATTLIIQGFGFSSMAANDTVVFSGGATGKVTSAMAMQLTVTKLSGLVAGNLSATVKVNGESSGSVQVATVTPVVTAGTAILLANAASLVIHGFGFSSTAADDTVTFGDGAAGKVAKATATTLTVTGLSGLIAGSLTATVTSNSLSSTSAVPVASVLPVVTADTASLSLAATSLTINGFGFDPNSANDVVTFSNGATGTVSSATNNQLIVTNLSGLTPGVLKASVDVDGQNSETAVEVADVT